MSIKKNTALGSIKISDEAIREAISDAGYEVVSITHEG